MGFVIASKHSLMRAKERMGLNEQRAIRMMERACEKGLRAEDCKIARDRAYLRNLEQNHRIAIAYAEYCFIFDTSGVMITVYPLPKHFGTKGSYFAKEEINAKSYRRAKDYYKYAC